MSRPQWTYEPNGSPLEANTGGGNAEQTINLPPGTTAFFLSAKTQSARVTLNDEAATATNGMVIIAGAQPLFVPVGYPYKIRFIGEAANCELNVIPLR